jgi:hypothetical protein
VLNAVSHTTQDGLALFDIVRVGDPQSIGEKECVEVVKASMFGGGGGVLDVCG